MHAFSLTAHLNQLVIIRINYTIKIIILHRFTKELPCITLWKAMTSHSADYSEVHYRTNKLWQITGRQTEKLGRQLQSSSEQLYYVHISAHTTVRTQKLCLIVGPKLWGSKKV